MGTAVPRSKLGDGPRGVRALTSHEHFLLFLPPVCSILFSFTLSTWEPGCWELRWPSLDGTCRCHGASPARGMRAVPNLPSAKPTCQRRMGTGKASLTLNVPPHRSTSPKHRFLSLP